MTDSLQTVLVVGAGPTGMMAALELSRFGIPVRLVEKAREPATTSRALGVQARTLELLEQRGLSAALVSKGNPVHSVNVYGTGSRLFHLDFAGIDSSFNYLLFAPQTETEKVLRDALRTRSVEIEWDTALIGFSQTDRGAGVVAVLAHEDGAMERLECGYLISAEGAHSVVRATSGLVFEGKSFKEDYALGDFHVEGELSDQVLHIFSSVHGFLGMFPMGNKRFRLIASNPIGSPANETAPSIEELQQLFEQRSHIPLRFHDMNWSSWFHINSRMVHQMRVGRVFIGGDSAHIHSPAGGQGMNTGIQDMVNLGWKMAMVMRGEANPELLDTYASDRMPVIKNVLTQTEALTRVIGNENPLFRSVFNHIAPWVVSADSIQQGATERMSQLALDYRHSRLSMSDGHAGTLRAGDRVPDLPVFDMTSGPAGVEMRSSTLFRLMDASRFTLFFSNIDASKRDETNEALTPWRHLICSCHISEADRDDGKFAALLGSSPSILLVRPDGYLAFTGSDESIDPIIEFCRRWLVPRP